MKKEYEILCHRSPFRLAKLVNHAIDRGKQPQGGVAVLESCTGTQYYYQAMIKKTENGKESKKDG